MDPSMHTFGGSALDRHVFDFETAVDGGSAGAPAGADPSPTAPVAEPPGGAQGGEPVSSSAGATELSPAWSPDDPTFLQAVDDRALGLIEQRFAPIAQLLEQQLGNGGAGAAAAAGPGLAPLDPFSEDFGAAFDQRLEQLGSRLEGLIGQVAQPLHEQREQATVAEGNQRLQDMIADDVSRNGDFPRAPGETESKAQSLVQPLAEAMFPQIAARYGNGPRAAEAAIQQASQTIRGIIAEAKAAGVAEHTNQLGTLAGARGEPGPGAAGAQGLADSNDPAEITRRYAASGRALGVAGT